ncbi:MAG: peptide ABC transporter substrate-binding protein [Chloroflexi bacterium]|nr:peptide ABC transporter substrate-binding protein [Chloroflexota bacterium]
MKKTMLVLGLLIVVAALAACATPTEAPKPAATTAPAAPAAPTGPKVLRIGRATYPSVIDPQKSSFGIEIEVMKFCYEGILAIDAKGNIGPGSADKWTIAPDGKSIVFHIRDGLKRADGTALNASDFEYALKRAVDPGVAGKQYADILSDIKGAGDLIGAEGKKPSEADLKKMYDGYGVKADDSKRELTVSFDAPAPYWTYVAYIWETYVPDKKKVDAAPDSWWTKADGHNCYGPFTIKSIEEGKRIVYQANPTYWRGKPKLDRIEVTYITDEAQRFEAYKKDEFDLLGVLPPSVQPQVDADAKLKGELVRYAGAVTRAFQFNQTKKPFDDKNVRAAFSQMVNRVEWVRDVFKGQGVPTTRWIPPGVPGAQPGKPGVPASDAKASVETLVKAGYGSGDKVDCAKLGEIKLTFGSTAANRPRFEWLAAQIQKTWGCNAVLDPVDPTVLTSLVKDIKTHPQVAYGGWIQDYPHPQNWLSVYFKCTAFAKRFGYCNKDNDAVMTKADATVNFDEAVKLYSQAEDTLLADIPFAFIVHEENIHLIKPWVNGPKDNPSSSDAEWAGEWGPVWMYDIDLTKVPAAYPKQ